MEVSGFPTSADIYLELDGKKVAVVQSYSAKATKTSQRCHFYIPFKSILQSRGVEVDGYRAPSLIVFAEIDQQS